MKLKKITKRQHCCLFLIENILNLCYNINKIIGGVDSMITGLESIHNIQYQWLKDNKILILEKLNILKKKRKQSIQENKNPININIYWDDYNKTFIFYQLIGYTYFAINITEEDVLSETFEEDVIERFNILKSEAYEVILSSDFSDKYKVRYLYIKGKLMFRDINDKSLIVKTLLDTNWLSSKRFPQERNTIVDTFLKKDLTVDDIYIRDLALLKRILKTDEFKKFILKTHTIQGVESLIDSLQIFHYLEKYITEDIIEELYLKIDKSELSKDDEYSIKKIKSFLNI